VQQGEPRNILFIKLCCKKNKQARKVTIHGRRIEYVYAVDIDNLSSHNLSCLKVSHHEDNWLWHPRLGNASMHTIKKPVKNELVRGLPTCNFKYDHLCEACARGKQVRRSFKSKNNVSTTRSLELLRMDLCGLIPIQSPGHRKHILVIVDDYSRFTWVSFLKEKNEAFKEFSKLCKRLEVYKLSNRRH